MPFLLIYSFHIALIHDLGVDLSRVLLFTGRQPFRSPQAYILIHYHLPLHPLVSTLLSAIFFLRSIHNTNRAVCVDCKIIYMLFTGSVGPYWEKLCPRSWVLRPKTQFLPIRTDQSQWITCLFFSYWDLKVSGKFSSVSLQPMCVSCWWSARSIANQSKIIQHDS